MPKILLAGQDVSLLGTRAAVLAKTGCDVISCIGSQTVKTVESERPDLVVLCHSLLEGEAESLADEIRKCCRTTKVLLVLSGLGSDFPLQGTKFDAMCLPNPERLIARVSELLGGMQLHPAQAMKGDGSASAGTSSSGDYQM